MYDSMMFSTPFPGPNGAKVFFRIFYFGVSIKSHVLWIFGRYVQESHAVLEGVATKQTALSKQAPAPH
jgi:hypothetical protein